MPFYLPPWTTASDAGCRAVAPPTSPRPPTLSARNAWSGAVTKSEQSP